MDHPARAGVNDVLLERLPAREAVDGVTLQAGRREKDGFSGGPVVAGSSADPSEGEGTVSEAVLEEEKERRMAGDLGVSLLEQVSGGWPNLSRGT